MQTMKSFLKGSLMLLAVFTLFARCSDDEGSTSDVTGTVNFELTDGPIDDANIEGVFITVIGVEVDGEPVDSFTKQTINLMDYQGGTTKLLGSFQVEAGEHDDVTLVLDFENDANGNSPGAYVLATGGVKHDLDDDSDDDSEAVEVKTTEFEVTETATTTLVLDFDLRKAIKYEDNPTANDSYELVADLNLNDALRVVEKENTGKIQGTVSDDLNLTDRIVVYVYEKGEFDFDDETDGEVEFEDALASATVNQGNFTIAFLEEGEYEIHAIGYEDADNDGDMEIMGEIDLDILGGIDLTNVSVTAKGTVSLNLSVLGILNP